MRTKTSLTPQTLLPWNIFMAILVYGYLIWVVFVMFFETYKRGITSNSKFQQGIYGVTFFLFIIEILIQLQSSYYQGSILEQDKGKIAKRYLGWHLLTDLAGFVGVVTLYFNKYQQLSGLFYLKVYGLRRYDQTIGNELSISPSLYQIYRVVRVVLIYFLFANLASCIFFFMDYYQYTHQNISYQNDELWLMATSAMYDIADWNIPVQYLYSVYWSLISAATIGYGDITPKNIYEVLYVTIFFAPNILFWSYLINTLFQVFQEKINQRTEIVRNVACIGNMLKYKEVEKKYFNLVSYYVKETIGMSHQNQEGKEILHHLSNDLRVELQRELYTDVFKPFLSLHPKIVLIMADIVKQAAFFSREKVDPGTNFIYLLSGELKLSVTGLDPAEFQEGQIEACTFGAHSRLNLYSFITNSPNPLLLLATTSSSVLYLVSYSDLIGHPSYPLYSRILTNFAVGFSLNRHDVMCSICKRDHLSHQCPIFVVTRERVALKAIRTASSLTMVRRTENQRQKAEDRPNRERNRMREVISKGIPLVRFQESYCP